MLIELEYPFSEVWEKGYLREGKDGRKRVDLVNWPTKRTTISYARYLLSVKEGRFLNEDEEADHIDKDRTNDSIDNLQILTKEEHKIKSKSEFPGLTMIHHKCYFCGKDFKRRKGQANGKNVFCSRSCNGKYGRQKRLIDV